MHRLYLVVDGILFVSTGFVCRTYFIKCNIRRRRFTSRIDCRCCSGRWTDPVCEIIWTSLSHAAVL